ncbi:pyridoxal phosphate-dependent aminotransferase [Vagococcus carniphilus]|uniref:pyridoxal phosphate-dependent aminotransferase n=1 Tax=Vagococcus carniphilus TaxID=218144 RepID=UPI003B5A131B
MDSTFLSKIYQEPEANILLEFGAMASKMDDLLDLSYGDPDITTDARIIEAAFNDAKNGHTHYTAPSGDKEFLKEAQHYYNSRYGLSVELNQIRATVGALHGIFLALTVLLDEGDEVIIHEPYFTPYKTQIRDAGGKAVIIPTYEKDDFQIDIDILKKAITPRTKVLILNTPNNPTGSVFSTETLKKIAELAIEHNFYIFSDEVYDSFCFEKEYVSIAKFAPENTVIFNSFSKTFAMTGWRVGYMIAPTFINEACYHLDEGICFSAPSISQRAGVYALQHINEIMPDVTSIFEERLRYIEKRVEGIPFMSLKPIKGSIYAFINISGTGLSSVDFSMKLLEEQKVLVVPGKAFGDSGDNYIRFAATRDLETLKEAFDKIEKLTF